MGIQWESLECWMQCLHATGEETDAHRGGVTDARLHSQLVAERIVSPGGKASRALLHSPPHPWESDYSFSFVLHISVPILLLLLLYTQIQKYKRKDQLNEAKCRTLHGCGYIKRIVPLSAAWDRSCLLHILKMWFYYSCLVGVCLLPPCDLWFIPVCLWPCEGAMQQLCKMREELMLQHNEARPSVMDAGTGKAWQTCQQVCARYTIDQPCKILSQIKQSMHLKTETSLIFINSEFKVVRKPRDCLV